mmetsp:Transcript_25613/g.44775  ORF Transcript_25613/g.44775 Transcript_25613/m.44775 type:complete len:288 (-) Transcript_25613:705-1568(-)
MSLLDPGSALKYCEQEVAKYDELAQMHSMFIPRSVRPYYFAIQQLRIQMFKTREQTHTSTLRSNRQTWWLTNLDNIWENRPAPEPLSIALHEIYKHTGVHKAHLVRMVKGRLEETEMSDWLSLDKFLDDNYTMQFYALLEIFQMTGEEEFNCATYVGRAIGIADLLKRTKYYLESNRVYFPKELLLKHNIPINIISEEDGTQQVPEQFYDAVLDVAAYGKQSLDKARSLQSTLPKYANIAFLPLVEAEDYYARLAKRNFGLFNPKIGKPWAASLLFRMARHFRRGVF